MSNGSLSDADRILRSGAAREALVPSAPAAPVAEAPAEAPESSSGRLRWVVVVIALVFAVLVGLGSWWSFQPDKFDIDANAEARIGDGKPVVPGATTVAAVIGIADTLLYSPGGYLINDVMPPGTIMDNAPNWQYGALTELRDTVRALRNDLSRSQTQSIENEDLKDADSKFNFDTDAWVLPSAEDEYGQGIESLEGYLAGLAGGDPRARFYARADNLGAYLAVVEKRLGSYGQRLSASVGNAELLAGLGAGTAAEQSAVETMARTPWNEIDDVFFEARGYAWALLHTMKAMSVDFAQVLKDKNAEVSMQQVIRDLEYATVRKWSPLVLNGDGFGVLANHSLVLASYISRANAAVLDLRVLLQSG